MGTPTIKNPTGPTVWQPRRPRESSLVFVTRERDGRYYPWFYDPSMRDYGYTTGYLWTHSSSNKRDAIARARRHLTELRSKKPPSSGDRTHRHRSRAAPTFSQEAKISRKIRLLRREGYGPKQAAAIAYRMAGVPKRRARTRLRRRR